MNRLGWYWTWDNARTTLTTDGYQAKLVARKIEEPEVPAGRRPAQLTVLSTPCRRSCEAKEDALVRTLDYISFICGFMIGDLHFSEYWVQHRRPIQGP